ncbi:hypothetical protein N865_10875 [Intrasporangium oryzae NRRL B-24470]|uniref:DUF4240 domain-containing protein n=1 Tax=Intrasporangium oryzae NRRL B-24470 TaxID=1386089 RepID=W9G7S0_9MICO|nr:DUF4240 domain-containing protein [Intrasporangium oryzae]EWT01327.1 hypothetical protein N865_10875 [Intrasporangium oryzae NRRL B-24470]
MRLLRRTMSGDDFWTLIDSMEGQADDDAVERLVDALAAAGRARALAFQERLARVLHELDREMLAAQPVRFEDEDEDEDDEPIPLSDDSFLYLRAGIVALGRETYAAVLADPAALASRVWPECEGLLYAAEEAAGVEYIETKVSFETGTNVEHWSQPEVVPDDGVPAPRRVVWVDGEDLDDPLGGFRMAEDGGEEELVAHIPPRYLNHGAFFAASDLVNQAVEASGGLPDAFGGRSLACVVQFGEQVVVPEVRVARDDFDGKEVMRSSVWVSHDEARAWPKPERTARVTALAARAALAALPPDHGARPELEALASVALGLEPTHAADGT